MNKPEKKFRAGAVSAVIWKNHTQKNNKEFSFHTISLERNYKDGQGNWKSSSSLRLSDLPKACLVLNKAFEHLVVSSQDSQISEQDVAV